jgi:hypothetical protein
MEWLPTALLGIAILVGMAALVRLAHAVRNNTRAVEALRVTLERDCGAGDDQ